MKNNPVFLLVRRSTTTRRCCLSGKDDVASINSCNVTLHEEVTSSAPSISLEAFSNIPRALLHAALVNNVILQSCSLGSQRAHCCSLCNFFILCSLFQTYIGSVLVSVNPYKELEIYSKQNMERYRGVSFYEVSPHL